MDVPGPVWELLVWPAAGTLDTLDAAKIVDAKTREKVPFVTQDTASWMFAHVQQCNALGGSAPISSAMGDSAHQERAHMGSAAVNRALMRHWWGWT